MSCDLIFNFFAIFSKMHLSISTLPVILSFLKFCVARTSWVERHQEKQKQKTNYRSFQNWKFWKLKNGRAWEERDKIIIKTQKRINKKSLKSNYFINFMIVFQDASQPFSFSNTFFLACRKFENQNYKNLMNKSFLFKIWTTFPQPV